MNEEQIFLANAYLDGELTDEERRLAEGDPAVMAEVDELRALQAEIRAVEPPSAAAREAAVAAAMAEFSAVAASATPPPSTVVPYRPRPAYTRILAVAAAVVGVGVLGVVVANFPSGDDDDSADDIIVADEPAAEEPAEEPATEREFAEADAADGGAAAEEPAAEPAAEAETALDLDGAEAAEDAADEAAGDDVASDDMAAEPAEEPAAEEPADAELSARPGASRDLPIVTPDELGRYGAALLELIARDELPATPETDCEPVVLDRAFLLFDDVVTEVLISIDPQASVVFALDPDSCDIVLDGPLPG